MIQSIILISTLIFSISSTSLANSLRSKVEVKQEKDKINFKVIPNEGLIINPDGPWSLRLKNGDKENKWDKKSFDLNTASISVPKSIDKFSEFTLVAFVCTADKKKCYRDVHKESL
jgi:hypothetical protein